MGSFIKEDAKDYHKWGEKMIVLLLSNLGFAQPLQQPLQFNHLNSNSGSSVFMMVQDSNVSVNRSIKLNGTLSFLSLDGSNIDNLTTMNSSLYFAKNKIQFGVTVPMILQAEKKRTGQAEQMFLGNTSIDVTYQLTSPKNLVGSALFIQQTLPSLQKSETFGLQENIMDAGLVIDKQQNSILWSINTGYRRQIGNQNAVVDFSS